MSLVRQHRATSGSVRHRLRSRFIPAVDVVNRMRLQEKRSRTDARLRTQPHASDVTVSCAWPPELGRTMGPGPWDARRSVCQTVAVRMENEDVQALQYMPCPSTRLEVVRTVSLHIRNSPKLCNVWSRHLQMIADDCRRDSDDRRSSEPPACRHFQTCCRCL